MLKITNHAIYRENVRSRILSPQLPNLEENDLINMEKGIYNYSIKEASRRKIVKNGKIPILRNCTMIDCAVLL